MVVFTMAGVKKHLMLHQMFQATRRIAYRGQVFSAPMNLHDIVNQIERADTGEYRVALPHTGEVLASIVQV